VRAAQAEAAAAKTAAAKAEEKAIAAALQLEAERERFAREHAALRMRADLAETGAAERVGTTAKEVEAREREWRRRVDDAARTATELRAENDLLRHDLAAARAGLHSHHADATTRDGEVARLRTALQEQAGKVTALHAQLAGFIQREARDAARADVSAGALTGQAREQVQEERRGGGKTCTHSVRAVARALRVPPVRRSRSAMPP